MPQANVVTRCSRPAGSARLSDSDARTASQVQCGEDGSIQLRVSAVTAMTPKRRPQSLPTDRAAIRTRNRSSSVQEEIQVSETSSTPAVPSRRQAGGRKSVADIWETSWSQPTAGSDEILPSSRLSASNAPRCTPPSSPG